MGGGISMDWIEEKTEALRIYIRNLSFRKAMLAYILVLAVLVWGISYLTILFCWKWENGIWGKYNGEETLRHIIYQNGVHWYLQYSAFDPTDRSLFLFLDFFRVWCPFFYAFGGMVLTIFRFYRRRLALPLSLLQKSVENIRGNNLDFRITYDSRDELGQLCDSVEEMRLELIRGKKEMWRLMEQQKELNAAFAHDLRTPLTVLHGYTDFLARYIPEGKISEEKLQNTLALMSQHLKRLEEYSRTMKGIRSIDEVPFVPEKITFADLCQKVEEILFALNQVRDIQITHRASVHAGNQNIPLTCTRQKGERYIDSFSSFPLYADLGLFIEVLENLLSNAIRYATRQIEVLSDYDETYGEVTLSVRDDGCGFSEEKKKNALKPYYKEYPADAADEHFGIGLPICKKLCRKHGGTLNIANSIQGGAVITASFSVKSLNNS